MYKLIILSILFSSTAQGKLLDKIAGVINDNVYTLSEINRIQNTLGIRKEIAGFIYKKTKMSKIDILNLLQNGFIIKDKLSELGFVVSDDAVESRIEETVKGLRLTRKELSVFLKTKGITENEYFELIREAMEYQIFQRRIIAPLVNITDQELKSFYYKLNKNNKALSFKYKVVDFVLPQKKVLKSDLDRLPAILANYQKTGNLPSVYRDLATNDLGTVSDDDLPKPLSQILRSTDEKTFSKNYIRDGQIHVFYVVEKELAESADFLRKRNQIYNAIFVERSGKISENWISREALNYYILKNI